MQRQAVKVAFRFLGIPKERDPLVEWISIAPFTFPSITLRAPELVFDMRSKLKQEFSAFYAKATSGDIKIDLITAKDIDLQVSSGDINIYSLKRNMSFGEG